MTIARKTAVAVAAGDAWWSGAYAAWQAENAASLAASYLDITGNGRNLTVGVAPTLGVNGWTSTGTAWLQTPVVPAIDMTVVARFSGAANTADNVIFGSQSPTFANFAFFSKIGASYLFQNATSLNFAGTLASGTVAIAGRACYVDGVFVGSLPASGAVTYDKNFVLMARRNTFGNIDYKYTGNLAEVGIWDTVLDDATIATKTAQMSAL